MAWYLERSEESSDRLLDEFQAALRFLQEFPSAMASKDGIQRIPVRGFPYVLVFDPATNRVLALAHTSRRPGYWRERL